MTNIGALSGGSSGGITGQLDVQWIVEQIIYAKQQPIRDLETYEVFYEAKKEAFQELNTKVSALESALYNLNNSGFETKSASLSREDYLTADASTTADNGQYSIIIQQLASTQSDSSTGLSSRNDQLLTDDTFQIYQDAAKTILLGEVDYSGGTQSLTDLKDAINSLGLDVTATVIQYDTDDYRLQLTSDDTGTDNAFYVTADVDLGWSNKVSAADAQIYVNNPDDDTNYITRSSNTIDDVISGVTLNLLEADDTKTTTLTIGSDSSNLKENIQTFVTAFNETMDYLNAQFTFDEDRDAAGVLSGESAAVKIKTDLLTLATSRVGGHDGSNDYSSFAVIGLEI
ncbi:MAG: flagellar filament capping protein FliD, partial [bacterium]|nr:flagellar filament capping protein FliD [bacterium]